MDNLKDDQPSLDLRVRKGTAYMSSVRDGNQELQSESQACYLADKEPVQSVPRLQPVWSQALNRFTLMW